MMSKALARSGGVKVRSQQRRLLCVLELWTSRRVMGRTNIVLSCLIIKYKGEEKRREAAYDGLDDGVKNINVQGKQPISALTITSTRTASKFTPFSYKPPALSIIDLVVIKLSLTIWAYMVSSFKCPPSQELSCQLPFPSLDVDEPLCRLRRELSYQKPIIASSGLVMHS